MNKTIKLLMLSDIFLITGFGLIGPILAIFIKDNVAGGTIFMASLAMTIFMVTKSIVQLPFSKYVDKHDHKVKWLILGTFLISLVPIIYIFAKDIKIVFIAQVLHGIGSGLAYPTWLGLWSTHLDKKHESFEWATYSTSVTVGSATAALVGGWASQSIGFQYTFLFVFVLALVGAGILFGLEKRERKLAKPKFSDYNKRRKAIALPRYN